MKDINIKISIDEAQFPWRPHPAMFKDMNMLCLE